MGFKLDKSGKLYLADGTGEVPSSPDLQQMYEQLFGKQATQDSVDLQSVPGKTAADSASVLQNTPTAAQDIVNSSSVPGRTAADSAATFEKAGLVPGKSAASSAEVFENAPVSTPNAQSVVDAQSLPGKTAADSAQVFENAGAIPNKSAADSASVFEANPGATERALVPTQSEAGFTMPGHTPAAKDVIETTGRTVGEETLPSVVEKGGLPAAMDVAEKAGLPSVLEKIASKGGTKMIPVIGEALMAADALHGALGTSGPMDGQPVPGRPGYVFKGDEIVPAAKADEKEPSLFDMVSSKYKELTPSMTAAPKSGNDDEEEDDDATTSKTSSAAARKTASVPAQASAAATAPQTPTSSLNPLLQKYLQDRADMQAAQEQSDRMRLRAALARTGSQLAASTYGATNGVSEAPLKSLEEAAQTPIQHVQQLQDAGMKGIQQQQELMKAQAEQEANDPNSAVSKATRAAYAPILQRLGIDTAPIASMGANAIKAYADKPLETAAKLREQEQVKQLQLAQIKTQKDLMLTEKQRAEDEKDAAAIANNLNYLKASSRSALGSAANAKVSVNRLVQIAADPTSTGQDMQNVYADLNRVVSNTTTLSGTEHQAYNNLNTKLAGYISYLTSNPTAPNIPEVKQHIIDVAKQMDKVSDGVIEHNSRMVRVGHEGWINRHPDQWQRMIQAQAEAPEFAAFPQTTGAPTASGSGGKTSAPTPSGAVKVSNGKQSYWINPDDLPHAIADGFSKVE